MYRGTTITNLAGSLQRIARALGGKACGDQVRVPGPRHSPKYCSLSVKTRAPHGFVVHSFADRWGQ
jgi:hypothetical protein